MVCVDMASGAPPPVRSLVGRFFDALGALLGTPEDAVPALEREITGLGPAQRNSMRLAAEVRDWALHRSRRARRKAARCAFEADLKAGKHN